MKDPTLTPPDDDASRVTQTDILSWIHSHVWTGEYDGDEVALLIEDQLDEHDELDERWLRKAIRSEIAAKRKAETNWPKVTDCDRLDRVFQSLERQHVIALHIAGFTQSDGLEEVEDEYHEAGGKKSMYAGHCFYTKQDQEHALNGDGMHIGFGHLSGNDAKGIEVGNILRAALLSEGLNVEWDGTIKTRLYVKGFCWQRRGPRN